MILWCRYYVKSQWDSEVYLLPILIDSRGSFLDLSVFVSCLGLSEANTACDTKKKKSPLSFQKILIHTGDKLHPLTLLLRITLLYINAGDYFLPG